MIIEHMSISAPEGQAQELCSALASLTGPTEVQQGCVSCRMLLSWHNPNEIVIQTKWTSVDDLIVHLQSDTYKRLLLLMELSPSPPVLQFYTVQEIRGLDLVEMARGSSGSEKAKFTGSLPSGCNE